jgi:type I restriction enzyme M protein
MLANRGGEFFTPQHVSKLIAKLAMHKQTSVNKIYDPACGSGSLLLQAKKHFDAHIIEEGFFGQEINHTTYNLARMNMFLHNINYDKFNIQLGNTLIDPHFGDEKPFDAIVSNPPYSVKWIGSDDPTLINDDRFAPAGVLAPKSKADFAFVLHALSYLSSKGRAAIVCFPGIFYRGGAEQKIRQYLVDNNYVETVISLAPNLFYGTTIAVNILVLAKNKTDTNIQFIDASGLFKKETNNNVLLDAHIDQIMQVFDSKENVDHFAQSIPFEKVTANDYNLSVSSYVEAKDNREVVEIAKLNAELKTTVARIDQLRKEIDAIVAEIEGEECDT